MRNMRRPLAVAILCVAMCLATGAPAGAEMMSWKVAGSKREALVIEPTKPDPSGKAPVLFVFHGHGGDIEDAHLGMHFEKSWPEAIVVYMQGLPTNALSDPQGYGWIYDKARDGERDIQFVDAVLATLRAKFAMDERRVYAAGFSNGAMFTYVLWGTRPQVFAAFAAVAGRIVPAVHLREPKPILHIAGRQDAQVAFQEQLKAIETARETNGATGGGSRCGQDCLFYASARGDTPVVTYIHPGGHVFPEVASGLIVEFLKPYKLEK